MEVSLFITYFAPDSVSQFWSAYMVEELKRLNGSRHIDWNETGRTSCKVGFGKAFTDVTDVNIEGDHYVAVKYIQHSEKGSDWVKLVSHNEAYSPKDVQMKDINAFAIVKFSVRMNTMF